MSLIISIGFRNLVYRINIISKFNLKDAYSYIIREMKKYEIMYIRKFIHHHRRYFPNPTMKYKCIRHIKVRTRQNSKLQRNSPLQLQQPESPLERKDLCVSRQDQTPPRYCLTMYKMHHEEQQ